MKLMGKLPTVGEPGKVKLIAEDSEDMWHAYNLVRAGDTVTATTFRKVAPPPGAGGAGADARGAGGGDRVKLTLTLHVLATEYDPAAPSLRVSGANATECAAVRLGAHHTLEVAPGRAFTLGKSAWDAADVDRVRTATDVAATADLAVLLVQDGLANLVLVGAATSRVVAKIEQSLPRKHGAALAGYDKAVASFHDKVVSALVRHVDWGIVKCVLIAGPGFAKDAVRTAVADAAVKQDIKPLRQNLDRVVLAHASCAYPHAVREVLASPAAKAAVADTAAARGAAALDAFFEALAADPSRAFYGPGHVAAAADLGAIAVLLLSDSLFRCASPAKRAAYTALADGVRAAGGEVHILSAAHASGEALDRVTGVAAVLRFPAPQLEDVELPDPFQ